MKWLVNAKEMKTCDSNTIEQYKMPSEVLMERAALAILFEIEKRNEINKEHILVICGNGNNGGDGIAVARLLQQKGYRVDILLCGDTKSGSFEMKKQLEIAKKYEIPIVTELEWIGNEYTLLVDAIFGIGLSRNIEGEVAGIVQKINDASSFVMAIDIPSGIDANTGNVMGIAVKADVTVTFAYEKIGQLLYPGADYVGELICSDIGINEKSWLDKKASCYKLDAQDLNLLPKRMGHSHKGTYGKVLIIAGKINMAGAAIFAARAAYASGAGLVKIFTTEENRVVMQQAIPEAILVTYSAKKIEKAMLIEEIKWADVIAVGPGIGTDSLADEMVKTVLENAAVPVIIDADGLNILAKDTSVLLRPHTEVVITPHLGEMANLQGVSVSYIADNLITSAEEFAREYNVICVLKDARSICSIPYGKTYINTSGNNGMATAGSGDCLTGLIASLIGQGLHAELAAPLGTFIHGCAGDVMIEETGYRGLMATDLINGIKKVMK